MTTPPFPVVPVFPAGNKPADASFNAWWYNVAQAFTVKPMLRARQVSTAQPIGTGSTATAIEYDTIDEDPYNGWQAGSFSWTPPWSGWYLVNVLAFVQAVPALVMVRPSVTNGFYQYNLAATLPPTGHGGGSRGSFYVYTVGGQDSIQGSVTLLNAHASVDTSVTAGQLSSLDIGFICE